MTLHRHKWVFGRIVLGTYEHSHEDGDIEHDHTDAFAPSRPIPAGTADYHRLQLPPPRPAFAYRSGPPALA